MMDKWVTAAFTDDALVAELLSRLRQSSSEPFKPSRSSPSLLPPGWTHRRPRSKSSSSISFKKEPSATRCSPTNPLSWSGGAACTSDDYSYSYSNSSQSHCRSSDPSRSKGACVNDPACDTSSSSMRLRKKMFVELKEEENLLLKERVNLTRELASLHTTLEEQKPRSQNVKRVKVDLNLQSTNQPSGASGDPSVVVSNDNNQIETSTSGRATSCLRRDSTYKSFASSRSYAVDKEVEKQQSCFVLPDLNMMPGEEEIGVHFLSGIS